MQQTTDTPRLNKAINMYKKFHPEYGNTEPPLEDVIDWLLKRGGMDSLSDMSKRLDQIAQQLNSIGRIDPDKEYAFKGEFILALRVLSQVPSGGQNE